MKAIRLRQPAGLDNLKFEDMAGPSAPGRGEIKVRLRASSLNYHDYLVAVGGIPTPDGRIPMSDGAGEVLAVGEGVTDFAVGDAVVSTFFPNWLDGRPIPGGFAGVPGDGADGYAREEVVAPATAFTHTVILRFASVGDVGGSMSRRARAAETVPAHVRKSLAEN